VLASGYVQWQTLNDGKDLFRQRGCMGCHRYEGYDKEPEDLNSIGQQIKQIETQKKDNLKQTAYLMKQADAAESNEEANRLTAKWLTCAWRTVNWTGVCSSSITSRTA
jgi:hypothetical protein